MSNALAIASVSFVLVDLLNNGLIDRDVASTIGSEVLVSAWAPDLVDADKDRRSQLNLFLYNVTQNPGWRNASYPARDAGGERIGNPPLALDLHYLLTAYGVEQFHAEILLGYGMQLFHETPFLPRDAIRLSLSAPTQIDNATTSLPAGKLNLYTSGLADQIEQIKIWPQTLSTEEISRLWTAFQAKYRPTAAFQVSVVLIQSETPIKQALPVKSRVVKAAPFAKPLIAKILSISDALHPIEADQPILPGYRLVLSGTQLQGSSSTSVLFGDNEVFPPSAQITPDKILVDLPPGLSAGAQTLQVVQYVSLGIPPAPHRNVSSEPSLFTLRPVIQAITATTGTSTLTGQPVSMLELTVSPPVGAAQTVKLLLNQVPGGATPPLSYMFSAEPAYPVASPPHDLPPPSSTVFVPYAGVVPGAYLVRLQVDGAESLLSQDIHGTFNAPQVTL